MPAKLFDGRAFARSPIVAPAGAASAMHVADLSLWSRAGLKGSVASVWLSERGLLVPAINAAAPQRDGSLLARLAENEFVALAGDGRRDGIPCGLPDFTLGDEPEPGLCPVPRFAANAWFALAGARLDEALAKVCGIDLRPPKFSNHQVAQTMVARTSAILMRDDIGQMLRFHVIVDWTTAPYLWDALLEATLEYGGAVATAGSLKG